MKVHINEKLFVQRFAKLIEHHKKEKYNLWRGANCLELPIGKINDKEDSVVDLLCTTIGEWLLGYEFTDTLMIIDFTPNSEQIIFVTSSKKTTFLNDLKSNLKNLKQDVNLPPAPKKIEVLDRKDTSMEDVLNRVKKMGRKVGIVEKEKSKHAGDFVKEWYAAFDKECTGPNPKLEQVDVENALHDILSIKTQQELGYISDASKIVSRALEKIFKPNMESIIDEEKKIVHFSLAENTEEAIVSMKLKKKNDQDDIEIECPFQPIIQSGGKYNLSIHATNNDDELHFGTICCILGAKFKSYCATIARTYMIDASKQQAANYQFLLDIYKLVIRKLKPGVELGSIYDSALEYIRKKNPALEKHFLPSVGYGIGMSPRDDYMNITTGNKLVAERGMVFVVFVGFQDIPETAPNKISDERNKNYSLVIADTVALPLTENLPQVFTTGDYDYDDVSYSIDEQEAESTSRVESSDADVIDITDQRTTRTREKKGIQVNIEEERRRKREELIQRKREEYSRQDTTGREQVKDKESFSVDAKLAKGDIFSYKSPQDYPVVKHNRILIDKKRDTVLLPINGSHIPFHIATIKNVAKTEEGDYINLRINFKHSKANIGKVYAPAKMFPQAFFIKELSYKANKKSKGLTQAMIDILELRKKVSQKEKDINEKRKDVQKGELQLTRGARPPRLTDVSVRPGKKKSVGVLEAHENGLRFSPQKGERIDILYGNIKHAFFQAAQKDLIVLLHFHLESPIMIGKKAQYDIQFYTDVIEEFDQLVGRQRRNTTETESIEEEARERQLKQKLNKEFHNFAKKVEEKAGFEFDIPYRDLEFTGTPFRASVNLVPTVNCLVCLTEMPFFVLTLDEVEMVNFERIKFGLRNFDMVFVMKDYTKPAVTINSIPIDKLETLKDWLLQVEIVYFEGPVNLVWPKVLKTIREMPDFDPWGDEGWRSFLDTTIDDEEDEEEPQEEEYQPESVSEKEYSSDEYLSPDELSEEDSDAYEDLDEEEEEGEDWDTLEKRALESDERKRARGKDFSDSEDEAPRRPAKKSKPSSSRPTNGNKK